MPSWNIGNLSDHCLGIQIMNPTSFTLYVYIEIAQEKKQKYEILQCYEWKGEVEGDKGRDVANDSCENQHGRR